MPNQNKRYSSVCDRINLFVTFNPAKSSENMLVSLSSEEVKHQYDHFNMMREQILKTDMAISQDLLNFYQDFQQHVYKFNDGKPFCSQSSFQDFRNH